MTDNGIRSISNKTFTGLTNLRYIDLDDNYLESIPRGVFDDLINLRSLILDNNNLTRLDGELFKYNFKIEILSFSSNHLSVIGSKLITHLSSLIIADFNNNPCISEIYPDTVIRSDMIAKCTESKKPEQQLTLAESEKKKAGAKTDLVSNDNEDLRNKTTENLQEILKLDPNVEVQQQEASTLNQNNYELNKSSMNRANIQVLLGGILLLICFYNKNRQWEP
ncbi:unnamed protein product [Diamesa hyperborea]